MRGSCPFCNHCGAYDSGYTGKDTAAEVATLGWTWLTNPGKLAKAVFREVTSGSLAVGHKGRCPGCKRMVIECPHCKHINPYSTSEFETACLGCKKIYSI